MAVSPVLVIKIVDDSSVGVRARWRDEFVEHHIVLNSVLAYWWANDLPPVVKFLELFESVIKRTINELTPHKTLNLKYEVKADDALEKASQIEINLIEVEADDIGFKIDGKTLSLNGLKNSPDGDDEKSPFNETITKSIETPDIVLKKYMEMKNK
ncbi:hypothetical protein [Methanobrevibacter sp.]|uniref:hypothetical protein n=1 Tax=Methanobrevibacter sp. TaxID=66852 RepID=UPI00389051BD